MTCNVYNASGKVVDTPYISPYGGSANWTPTAAGSYYTNCDWRGYAQYEGTDIPYSLYGSGGNVNVGS